MTLLKQVLAGIVGMFVSDAKLSAVVLALVGIAAGLIKLAGVPPLIGGGILLLGCLALLFGAVRRRAGQP